MSSFFRDFDYNPGTIVWIEEELTDEKTLEQLGEECILREDMLLVQYGPDLLLDVGWYGGIKQFTVYVIQNNQWEQPTYRGRATDLGTLRIRMEMGIQKIKKLPDT
jgi:hypothetical protein